VTGAPAQRSSLRLDIASAYAVTAARIVSWVIVSAVVFRRLGAESLGLLTLVRATIGVLAYTSLGLGPAMVKMLADAERAQPPPHDERLPLAPLAVDEPAQATPMLAYADHAPLAPPDPMLARIYGTGERLALYLGLLGLILAAAYSMTFSRLHDLAGGIADHASALTMFMGVGMVMRLISDAPSGLLQARGRIALDNALLASAELAWGIWTALVIDDIAVAGVTFTAVNLLLLATRGSIGRVEVRALTMKVGGFSRPIARSLLAMGSMIVLAQVADFLYAPTDCILINRFLGADFVAYYSPAIQIDAGLLMLVSGLAAVLYPRSAVAHASGDWRTLRAYYVRGTLFSSAILIVAGGGVLLASPRLFRLWFHNPMSATQAILPLILIHTIVGGSSAVGRSILLAIGKVRAFTIAVLLAAVSNVGLSYWFVARLHLGLRGIVYGTIIAVTLRCLIWMPWYTLRSLKRLPINSALASGVT
jgi:O-antigen/teichoic acid export membrane protein